MGNGTKMRGALDHAGNLRTIDSLQTDHDAGISLPRPSCPDLACKVAVRFVPRSQQNRKNLTKPVSVSAYIGLKKDSEHADGCRFDAATRLTVIVDESDRKFITPLAAGGHELRLLLLHNGLSNKPISGSSGKIADPASGGGGITKEYIPSGTELDSYLRTTADLLELRDLCDSDAALAARLTLRFGDRLIPWTDFFFEIDSYDKAWQLVKNAGLRVYPIALVGEVKSVMPPNSGAAYTATYLNCKSRYHGTSTTDKVDVFEVSVQHEDVAWLNSFTVGSTIIMFGLWEAKDAVEKLDKRPSKSAKPTTFVTHKLILRPKFKKQLHKAF